MKKTFSIFLILSFLFNTAGYLLIFLVLQSALKDNIEEKIFEDSQNNQKVSIVFANSDLRKGIPGLRFFDEKEFSFNGKMYDVIEKTESGDNTIFYCVADHDEDNLNLVFNKTVEENSPYSNSKDVKNILLKKTIEEGLLLAATNNLIPQFEGSFNIISDKINYYVFFRIPTPPPDYILV